MTSNFPFYEEQAAVGEITQGGLRYRIYYDAARRLTICVLVPGQRIASAS